MTNPKAETAKVGTVWEFPAGSAVQRPDGNEVTIGEGGHVLDVPGTYTCGDESVTAK